MGLPEFDEEVIRDLATETSYDRGEEYADYGAVRNLVLEGESYRAHVYGTHRYTVRVWDDSGDVRSSCTCPYDWGGVCKHVVAVMLSVLEQQELGQAVKTVGQPVEINTDASVQVDDLIASLSHEQLQTFLRLQAGEFPKLIDNLNIFAQGAAESDKTVEAYTAEIAAALADGSFQNPYAEDEYEYSYYRDDDDDDDDDEYDTIADILKPHRDAAQKYLAQNNWIESAKIHEAIVHACGQLRLDDDDDDDDDDEYGYDRDDDYVAEAGHSEARRALQDWAELISNAAAGPDKPRLIERFVAVFAPDAYDLGAQPWEHAFQTAVQTAPEAEVALGYIDALKLKDRDPDKAGVLLHLLNLSGDTDRFLSVGQNAIRHHPHLALPLANKLVDIGQRGDAIKAAETALGRVRDEFYHFEHRDTREDLLRFLVKACDPNRERRKLLNHAETLLFEYNDPKDYVCLRDLLTTQVQRDQLIKQVQSKCEPEAVT
ncbi:MAG: SWIM zinc finger family protein, partial [Candidatus Tectomicrobia bacterium]|nr:SWIM zinc finger family protein [Candidatus Tectomicrobia bacterium]